VGVEMRVRQASEKRFDEAGHGGFADPAESQATKSDAELDGCNEVIQLLMKFLDGARADAVGGDELLKAGFADAD